MRILTFAFMLLCSHSSVSGFATVDVQLGQDVTLHCSNISNQSTQADWFRVVNVTHISCVVAMFGFDAQASYCEGFEDGRFEMSTNTTSISLKIKHLDFNDCGLYFCGIYKGQNTVIGNVIEIRIQDSSNRLESTTASPGDVTGLVSGVLGALVLILTLTVIALAVKVRKLQRAAPDDSQLGRSRDGNSVLTYAAVNVQAKPQRSHRATPQGQLDPRVVYATTR